MSEASKTTARKLIYEIAALLEKHEVEDQVQFDGLIYRPWSGWVIESCKGPAICDLLQASDAQLFNESRYLVCLGLTARILAYRFDDGSAISFEDSSANGSALGSTSVARILGYSDSDPSRVVYSSPD